MITRNTILLTRPIADSQEIAAYCKELGFTTLMAPMLNIEKLDYEMPAPADFSALIFTSANAVKIFCDGAGFDKAYFKKPVFCVGPQTKGTLESYGFQKIKVMAENGKKLCKEIVDYTAQNGSFDKPILHIRGEHSAFPIEKSLKKKNIQVSALPVYSARQANDVNDQVLQALKGQEIKAVLLYSKRTAEAFLDILKRAEVIKYLQDVQILCISRNVQTYVQRACENIPAIHTSAAGQSDGDGMRSLLRVLAEE